MYHSCWPITPSSPKKQQNYAIALLESNYKRLTLALLMILRNHFNVLKFGRILNSVAHSVWKASTIYISSRFYVNLIH